MGVITSANLRMDPLPEAQSFLTYEFATLFDGLEAGRRIMTQRWRPAVMRLYDEADRNKLNDILGLELTGSLLIVVCDGDQRLVDLESEAITSICSEVGGTFLGPGGAKTWWDGKYEPYAEGKRPQFRRFSAPPTPYARSTTCPTSIGRNGRTSRRVLLNTGRNTPRTSPIGSLGVSWSTTGSMSTTPPRTLWRHSTYTTACGTRQFARLSPMVA